MPYQRKTRDVWKLMVNYGYGHGWEHELTEFTIAEARQRLKEYRALSTKRKLPAVPCQNCYGQRKN